MGPKVLDFLFILQKGNQVNEMVSYTFLHPTAVTHCSYINSIGKCTSFLFLFFWLSKICQVFMDKKNPFHCNLN